MPVTELDISATKFAVVDLETTGYQPSKDRVIEIAVVHASLETDPEIAIQSLVNPQRPIRNREIHGINNREVRKAPVFTELLPRLQSALAGRVVVAHNATFDIGFLSAEFQRAGASLDVPFVCTLQLANVLDPGEEKSLKAVAARLGLKTGRSHEAGSDALLTALVAMSYFRRLIGLGCKDFGHLANFIDCPFLRSLGANPLELGTVGDRFARTAVRGDGSISKSEPAPDDYQTVLLRMCSNIDETEENNLTRLRRLQGRAKLTMSELRAIHARIFANVLSLQASNGEIVPAAAFRIKRVLKLLAELGWSPGSPVEVEGSNE